MVTETGVGDASRVRSVWPRVQAAVKAHGREWRALSPARLALLVARLREHPASTEDILVQAVHGAVAYWRRGSGSHGDFDPLAHLVPETVYRRSHFSKYLESYTPPQPAPCSSPARAPLMQRPAPARDPSEPAPYSREEGARMLDELTTRLQRNYVNRRGGAMSEGTLTARGEGRGRGTR